MLKVLCFGRLHGGSLGGIERHVESLIVGLAGKVRFVDLVPSRSGPPSQHRLGDSLVVETPSWPLGRNTPISPSMLWHARRLHAAWNFDLIHLHFPDPMSHAAALALPRSLPVVISWHSDIVRQKWFSVAYRPFLDRMLRRAAAVVVATPAHVRSSAVLPRVDLGGKIEQVPYGIDFDRFKERPARVAEIRQRFGEQLIFALGRHVYYKGFEYLIDAMLELPAAHLLLGGDGPLTGFLRTRARKHGVEGRVTFLARVPEQALADFYYACDVFCMPSVEPAEAFGLAQAEAMACGRPVVCCELENGVTYVNRHGVTGLVVPPRDPSALAVALRSLLNDPALRRRLGTAAAERIKGEFSMRTQCDRMLEVYQSVVRVSR